MYQWYVFALLLFVAFIAKYGGLTENDYLFGQYRVKYKWFAVLLLFVPLVYLAANRGNLHWGDTLTYRNSYLSLPTSLPEIKTYLAQDMKDKGFKLFSIVLKLILKNHYVIYFGVIAAICLYFVLKTFRDYSYNFPISIFLFIASADYLEWCYNGIRQFIPASIIFGCTYLILKKKYVPLIIIILILSTIHATALITIPFIFIAQGKPFNKKTILFMVGITLAVYFVDTFTGVVTNFMENSQYSKEVDQFVSSRGTSILRVLVYSIPAIISFVFRRWIDEANNPLINYCTNMSIATLGCYVLSAFTSGIFIGRFPIYFSLYNYILLPWIIDYVFNKESAEFIYIMMILLYFIFYYYQVAVVWNLR